MTEELADLSRVVLVDKPVGPTSFDIVRAARRGVRGRVGHAGTLDPFASGLLLVMIGHATRISSILMELPKEYEATVQFGAVSTTADPTGVIVPTGGRLKAGQAEEASQRFRGLIRQRAARPGLRPIHCAAWPAPAQSAALFAHRFLPACSTANEQRSF